MRTKSISKQKPVVWGSAIIGFGTRRQDTRTFEESKWQLSTLEYAL